MKYWRGYLVAAIIAACTWGLEKFAETHSALVDMVYPYVTRMAQTFLTEWSSSVDFCVWQVLLVAFAVLVLASVVLMVVLKWNPIQWLGWVLAAASIAVFLNTGIYGLNVYAGSIAEDMRLEEADYTVGELERVAIYYREEANDLGAELAKRSSQFPSLEELNEMAGQGFEYMKTQEYQSVFAGCTDPVKVLGWEELFTQRGIDGVMIGVTGEAAVNPQTPDAAMPFAICELMARRMCIANTPDAKFAAFLACRSNESLEFRYAAAVAAYRACCSVLDDISESTGDDTVQQIRAKADDPLASDDLVLSEFYGEQNAEDTEQFSKLLVSLYIQEKILPLQREEEVLFDPLDETQVDLSGIRNAGN